jgi:hypothetical protein
MKEEFEVKDKWIKIGTHLFNIEDMRGCWIQKNHLIIELEFKNDHVIYFFGKNGEKKCIKAFEEICELKNAYIVEADADYNPDIMKTFYGDAFNRTIKSIKMFETDKLKVRYQKKIDKLILEVDEMKKILEKHTKK